MALLTCGDKAHQTYIDYKKGKSFRQGQVKQLDHRTSKEIAHSIAKKALDANRRILTK